MNTKEKAITAYKEIFGKNPEQISRAPGRVNLLGEHVDYNDGFVLPAAIDRATFAAFSLSENNYSTLVAADFNEKASFSAANLQAKTCLDGSIMPEWVKYPAGVMWALQEEGLETRPVDAVFLSDVPRGSGLSSSASVEMAFANVWQSVGGWTRSPMALALLSQKAENKYVGVNCGIMDQFASACGVTDRLLYLDCRSLEWQSLPLSNALAIIVADTTVRRKLTSGEYNNRRNACEEAVRILKQELPDIRALRDVDIIAFNQLASRLPQEVEMRARHIVEEIDRSRQAVTLLESGNFSRFGELMNDCHRSLRDLYGVSCPELDIMAGLAQKMPGVFGARLTGAGFGGCTVNLVSKAAAETFARDLSEAYERKTGLHPEIYICRASAGAALEN
ncbi:MAG: galactokinase [Chloroflexota bacterium]